MKVNVKLSNIKQTFQC